MNVGETVWWIDESNFLEERAVSATVLEVLSPKRQTGGYVYRLDKPMRHNHQVPSYLVFPTEAAAWRRLSQESHCSARCYEDLAAEFERRAVEAEAHAR